jgi:glyoxylase-like metal-dependent hydrolase (beta-lactamase superfamily II)
MMEVAPNVHRLSFAIGAKPMSAYVLTGDALILVDAGIPSTPEAIYLPAIRALGRRPDEVRLVIITHADADHIGGNAAVKRLFPNALLACHALDERWAADPAAIMAERYDGFGAYGLRYDRATFDLLAGWMGPAVPMDLLLQDGVKIRLANDDWLVVRHVPGHTPGHICLFNPERRYALIGDAVFGQAQIDVDGGKAAAPAYTDVDAYRATIETIRALDADLLLGCHYPPMRGAEVTRFLDESRQWSNRAEVVMRGLVRERGGPLGLAAAIDRADPLLGPFSAPQELRWPLLAHAEWAAARGEAERVITDGVVRWRPTDGQGPP